MKLGIALTAVFLAFLIAPAEAKHRQHHDRHQAHHRPFRGAHYATGHRHRTSRHASSSRSNVIEGVIDFLGEHFPFVSGGMGRGPIPPGTYEITPDDVGDWGSRHQAIGIAHNEIGHREGIEIHRAYGDRTAGCVGIKERYVELRRKVLEMSKEGKLYLRISPGNYAIVPEGAT